MKSINRISVALIAVLSLAVASCYKEDPGPLQPGTRNFDAVDFDRVEGSDAVDVTITQGNTYLIETHGDRRDLDDLQIYKSGSTLIIKFENGRNRQYTTYVSITMPALYGTKLSGAVDGRISGFSTTTNRFDLSLSGASNLTAELKAEEIYASLSGASRVQFTGVGKKIDANVSGASTFNAFDYPAGQVKIVASGASHAKVEATEHLSVNASGASEIRYQGEPQVDAEVSGASWVGKD